MLKHIVALVLLSLLIVLTMGYAQTGLQWLISAHDWINESLTQVFSGGQAGNLSRQLIALLSIPIIVGLVPAIIYGAIKRSWFSYFMQFVWVTWIVEVSALIILYKPPVV